MLLALRKEGDANPVFKEKLLATERKYIFEDTSQAANRIDYIWGNGPNKNGQNRLRLSLVIYRMELQGKKVPISNIDLLRYILL